MKFSIGVGQKNYNHVGQLTNSSSCGFGEVQPVFSSIMLPKSTMSVKVAQKVRLMPMPYPTFGHMSLETVGKYVSFGDVFPQLDNLLSGLPYTYNIVDGAGYSTTSALVKSFPFVRNNYLQNILLNAVFSDNTRYADIDGAATAGTSSNSLHPVTIDGADYVRRDKNSATNKIDAIAYRYNDRGLRLRKIFLGLGYNPSYNDTTTLNMLPLLCYYKAYFDTFAPKRFTSFQDTKCFALIKAFDQFPDLFVNNSERGFIAGDIEKYVTDNGGTDVESLFFQVCRDELSMCFATDPTDWVSMHTASVLNNTSEVETAPSDVNNPGSITITNSGDGSPVATSAKQLTKVQFDLLRRITSSVTRDSLVGRSIKKWLDNKFGADITNQIYEDTITLGRSSLPIQISDIDSTSDTYGLLNGIDDDKSSPTGSLIGSYAGKGQGQGVGQFTAKSRSFGLFVVLMWLRPHEDYYQGIDTRLCAKKVDELPQPLYDGIGYELTPRAALWSDNGIAVDNNEVIAGEKSISDSTSFGYAPRYTGFKRYKGVINGDLSLRSKRESSKCMYLDKQIVFRDITMVPLLDGKVHYQFNSQNVPRASTEWRYIMKYPWLQNYNRIFYAPGAIQWNNGNDGTFPSQISSNSLPHDDNVVVHSLIQVSESNYLRPLSQSYDTFEVNGTTTIKSSGE